MKDIEIIPIALKKIEKRCIPYKLIEETLNAPEQIVDGYMGRKIRQRRYRVKGRDMLLRVIAEEEKDKMLVVTAYLTSQVERYWR